MPTPINNVNSAPKSTTQHLSRVLESIIYLVIDYPINNSAPYLVNNVNSVNIPPTKHQLEFNMWTNPPNYHYHVNTLPKPLFYPSHLFLTKIIPIQERKKLEAMESIFTWSFK